MAPSKTQGSQNETLLIYFLIHLQILPKYCIGKIKIADITWIYYFNGCVSDNSLINHSV